MKENRFGEGKLARFISGKGFYAALALCLIGAAAAAWLTVDKTLESLTKQNEVPISEVSQSSQALESRSRETPSSSSASARAVENEPEEPVRASEPEPAESAAAAAPESAPEESEAFWPFTEKTVYAMPAQGEIIQDYSDGELVKNETLGEWRTHDGIDIKCAAGTAILAPANGKVTRVWSDPLWGECVEMEHAGGVVSVFCGLAKEIPVKEGDELKLGDTVGTLGETNSAEVGLDSHLHFAMKQDGKYADPLEIMGME